MNLFDEITTTQEESHKKWFERWYEKVDIEKSIRKSAAQGYTGYAIQVSSCDDEYLRRRLSNSKTIYLLNNKLGAGFRVYLKEESGTNFLNMKIHKSYIKISWD